jgi:hypothetical protein
MILERRQQGDHNRLRFFVPAVASAEYRGPSDRPSPGSELRQVLAHVHRNVFEARAYLRALPAIQYRWAQLFSFRACNDEREAHRR